MLLVKPPSRQDLMAVLDGLLSGSLNREAVASWQRAVSARTGSTLNLTVSDGYWYFHSLALIDVPVVDENGAGYFIRHEDLTEYLLDIEGVAASENYRGIRRLRSHQIDQKALRWPLSIYRYEPDNDMKLRGLLPVRGIFEERGDMVEHLHLWFEEALYLIVRQFDEEADQVMILGSDRDPERLAAFMAELELTPFIYQ